jgi:hypothetical protein
MGGLFLYVRLRIVAEERAPNQALCSSLLRCRTALPWLVVVLVVIVVRELVQLVDGVPVTVSSAGCVTPIPARDRGSGQSPGRRRLTSGC